MEGTEAEENEQDKSVPNRSAEGAQDQADIGEWKYIINVSSRKFHRPGCESVQKMSRKNRQGFNGSREELIEMGYVPCKNCNP
jgi:methylphosphotriester-DNA--protein-cysteine methyltransferase